ncbi:NAD-dependent SIR2 family protein deacetylase [Cryobacterium psychrophilum]|uniref:protein acetyllysine N-acetyltransferase n=2 Tax=Cryobacterium psychrophilum TaxID=41988 RepID=A0A4Y8KQY9_9MICO|nr:NAD-dependent SIR2 family protein deacetylase [Cryobacterium psychrophilum]TFD80462.1 NAD-dependent deacetylase [Cryobacterium psychrophilum]
MTADLFPRAGILTDAVLAHEAPAGTPDNSTARTQLDALADMLRGRQAVVLTGAGLSTDSGIPDYRGEGAPQRTPMTFQTFASNERARKRYWAGSHLGWRHFRAAQPNMGHTSLMRLEASGVFSGIITQNVDGLHARAGSRHVVELHGSMDRVICLVCGQAFGRDSVAERLEDANPSLRTPEAVRIAPDGDVDVDDIDGFTIPACTVCGGMLKPNVVFFGELVPTERFTAAQSLVQAAEAFVIAGSSLAVNSGIRLLEQARRRKLPIIVINRGATKGDGRAVLKLDAGTSETLAGLADRLC